MTFPHILQNAVGSWPDAEKYMANWDWLYAMAKGNFLGGPGFEQWNTGTSFTNPANGASLADGWSLEKGGTGAATADITRESSTKDTGSYSMKVNITGAGSSDSYLRIKQSAANHIRFSGQSVAAGIRVKVGTASKVRLSITDGVSTAYSSYHTGDDTWQKLTVALACSTSISALTVKIEITADFTGAVYIDSAFLYAIQATMSTTARDALEYFGGDDPLSLLIGTLTVLGNATIAGTLGMSNAINEAKGADIASASTIDLDAATGNLVDVTGTTAITAITLSVGRERVVRFTGALTLTNGASLVLPGGANITTAAGDFAIFRGYASGVVRCVIYSRADGSPIIGFTPATQSDQETASSTAVAVTPGRQHFHPSAAKAWCVFNASGTVAASYNITSVSDNGTGDWTITIATDFSSASFACAGLAQKDAGGVDGTGNTSITISRISSITAGSIRIRTISWDPNFLDSSSVSFIAFGDQ